MKYLKIIFALYVLALSLVPCSDFSTCQEDEANIESSHSDSKNQGHQDNCTPFCTCNCCGANIAFLSSQPFALVNLSFPDSKKGVYKESGFYLFNHSIWQPPRI